MVRNLDRPCSPVIADRDRAESRRTDGLAIRIVAAPPTDMEGGRAHVCESGHRHGQVQRRCVHRNQRRSNRRSIREAFVEHLCHRPAQCSHCGTTEPEELGQVLANGCLADIGCAFLEQAEAIRGGEIQYMVADRHADAPAAPLGAEDAEGQVLDREFRAIHVSRGDMTQPRGLVRGVEQGRTIHLRARPAAATRRRSTGEHRRPRRTTGRSAARTAGRSPDRPARTGC